MDFARKSLKKLGISNVFLYYLEYFAGFHNNFKSFFNKLILLQFLQFQLSYNFKHSATNFLKVFLKKTQHIFIREKYKEQEKKCFSINN